MTSRLPVSVVIPARNAADTIAETFASLVAQTHADWEAIVIDDGSTDTTADISAEQAARDPRFRLLRGESRGVGAARNLGISQARNPLLYLLDADDLVDAVLLEKLVAPLENDGTLIGSTCGWARLTPSREVVAIVEPPSRGDLFPAFARCCIFPIHSCVVWTKDVRSVGGFDESLVTCEDWDLWLRLARTGRAFASVQGTLALYRMRERSASVDGRQMLGDGIEVLERARRVDERVPGDVAHREGATRATLAEDVLDHLCWTAGLALGSNGDATALAKLVGPMPAQLLDAGDVAGSLFVSALLPRCLLPADWPDLLDEIETPLDRFLEELERISGVRRLAHRARRVIDHRVLAEDRSERPRIRGSLFGCDLEVTQPIESLTVPAGMERVVLRVRLDGELIGELMLAPVDGAIPRSVLLDALTQTAWPILRHLFASTVYPELVQRPDDNGLTVLRGDTVIATGLPAELTTDPVRFHDEVGWAVFLQELFARPTWEADRFYDPRGAILGRMPSRVTGTEVELAEDIPSLTAAGPTTDVVVTLGGAPLGVVRVLSPESLVDPSVLLRAACTASGYELARVAVREGLLGRPLGEGHDLRTRLAEAARDRRSRPRTVSDHELLLGRRRPFDIGGPQSRSVALPVAAAGELLALADVANDPVLASSDYGRVLYDPELIRLDDYARPFDDDERPPFLQRLRLPLRTRLRRRSATADGRARENGDGPSLLPILMYHRIDEPTGGALDRYILHPDRFAEQLGLLRDEHVRTLSFDEVGSFMRARRPLPSRSVVLTFDDGFVDFLTNASPILSAFGCQSTLFVPTGRVGMTNTWDAEFGEEAPLLTWPQLRKVVDAGATIGSHSVTHPFLTELPFDEVVREAAVSRAAIIAQLGVEPAAFSFPYGDADPAVRGAIGGCGYAYAVTTEGRATDPADDRLALPRLEVTGELTLEEFARLVGVG